MIRCLTVLAILLLASAEGRAAPVFYGPSAYEKAADSPFAGGDFQYFSLENFEDALFNTPGISITVTGATAWGVTGTGFNFIDSVDLDDGVADHNGNDGRSFAFDGPDGPSTVITFSFDVGVLGVLPTSAGVVVTDIGRHLGAHFGQPGYGVGTVLFQAYDSLGNSLGTIGPSTFGDGATGGGTREDRFFGVTDLDGISKFSLTVNSTDWELDHVQYGAARQPVVEEVPEPSSAILLMLGACGAFGLKRRNASARS